MSQLSGWLNEKLGKTVHKVIFVKPFDQEGKQYIEICQRYFDPRRSTLQADREHEFVVDAANWVRQRGNRFIQYMDWVSMASYRWYDAVKYVKPTGETLSSREVSASKASDVAAAVGRGGAKLDAGLITLIAIGLAALMGGVLLGYFLLPQLFGEIVIPAPKPAAQVAKLLLGLL